MISKQEILRISNEKSLRPDVIEKDYILGWLLAGISSHKRLNKTWIFKGGTCLKKCYFDTYRFSEDLDFTLIDSSHIENDFLILIFTEITEWIYEKSGIEFPKGMQSFDIFINSRGNLSCQGKISYKGPISPRPFPRVKLDITSDECIVLPPTTVPIFHPYSDAKNAIFRIQTYAYEEVFGEKVRALAERTRPRDLYDVINLFRNESARPDPVILRDVIKKKCEFKKISIPNLKNIFSQYDSIKAGWQQMLGHQVAMLPDLQIFLDELPMFFNWLYKNKSIHSLKTFPLEKSNTNLKKFSFNSKFSSKKIKLFELIQFAATNRLCVDLEYIDEDGNHSSRRIEPYSARRSKSGDSLLAAVRRKDGKLRTYRFDRIINALVTKESFIPRYEIELIPKLPFNMKLIDKNSASNNCPHQLTKKPIYIYECPLCKKKFNRKSRSQKLNPHKTKYGYTCQGRVGVYLKKSSFYKPS